MAQIKINTPKKFNNRKVDLLALIEKYNPVLILEQTTKRELDAEKIVLRHKPLKYEARFKDNIIYVDFHNSVNYIWLCLSHELAHIILRDPLWHQKEQIKKILNKQKGVFSKYKYNFSYAIEQTLAILLQMVCENKAHLRKMNWDTWEDTFDCMGVKDFGKKLWKPWLNYLANQSSYKNIDEWILEILQKYYK